jgi:hypothetical protein
MGFLDKGKQKAIHNQTESIRKEAAGFGSQLTETIDLLEDDGVAGFVGGMKNALIGGKTKASAIQMLRFQNRDIHHVYFQPYQGLTVLPGEHHILINGNVPTPISFEKVGILGKKKWVAPANENIAQSLNSNAAISKITNQIKWEWGTGLSSIDLQHTLQLRPTGDGRTHIVLIPGRYGGFTTYHVGFGVFLNAAATFINMLKNTGDQAAAEFVHPTAFGDIFLQ